MTDGFALRLSFFYGGFFFYAGVALPFLPVWLEAKGLEAREIGLVLAAPLIVRVLAVPLLTRLADYFGRLRAAIIATAIASAAGCALIGMSEDFLAIMATTALAAIFSSTLLPLADAYALRGLAERKVSYGTVRLWGSATFIVANLAGGFIFAYIAARDLIWVLAIALALTSMAAANLNALVPEPTEMRHADGPIRSLWRSPVFALVIAGASLIQSSHAVLHGFATLQWAAKGVEGPVIGLLWALGVAAEIALFAASGRIVAALGPLTMIICGALGAVLRWAVMALDPPVAVLPFLQGLHALSFGATHLGAMHFLARAAPPRQRATAQGDFAAVQGVLFAATMGLSGVLVKSYGSLAYAAMAAVAAAGGLLTFAALKQRDGEEGA